MRSYSDAYTASLADPAAYWADAARNIDWNREWTQVLDNSHAPFTRWFVGAELNT